MQISNITQNFERDLKVKNYSDRTIKNYVSQVKMFLAYFKDKDSPKHISADDIKNYLLTAKEVNSQRHMHSAIKCLYKYTVHQPCKFKFIEYARKERKLPQIIDKDFLLDRISKIDNIKHKAIITLAYSTGMRVGEIINLMITDIDSVRMIITVRQAKGRKDRIVPLSQTTLDTLRQYFKSFRPQEYLFNGQLSKSDIQKNVPYVQYTERSCNEIVKKYLGHQYHMHLLRHSSFTALMEAGTDIRIIQSIAGHSSSKTTEIYTHVSRQYIAKVATPI